ncbi:MAG: hypothetical protein GPJ54_02080 [Candidatus Heimdallarchaeota archaeon]|nr:hypothetical protein [Candidatus Heimdallarchaeota archaeon]
MTNQFYEQLIGEYIYESNDAIEIDSITSVRFEIKMGEGFEAQTLSTRNVVSINQSKNSGNFDVLTQNSVAYPFFADILTNGNDDYFDSWIRFDGSRSDLRINLADDNNAHLLESSWLTRNPDFLGYSLTRISLVIDNFSYSSNNEVTTFSFSISWQYYGTVKTPSLVEPGESTKFIMLTSDTLSGLPIINLSASFSLVFYENDIEYEIPRNDKLELMTGDTGIYNFNILENETQLINSIMKENQDHNIDLLISTNLESGNKFSSTINGSNSQLFYQTSNPNLEFNTIILQVFNLNIRLYFDTAIIRYTLGWYFSSGDLEIPNSYSDTTESLSQTNTSDTIEYSLELNKYVMWSIYTTFAIILIVVILRLAKKL